MKAKQYKTKKCKACGAQFTPFNSMQTVCPGVSCALKYAEEKRKEEEDKAWRKHKKQWKEDNKSHGDLVKEAEVEFNKFIRERDKNDPCISCGEYKNEASALRGGVFDCGHYRSKGSAPHMRFNEDNAHKQCVRCNRDLSGNIVEYRKRLIDKIGLERVEAVENNNEVRKFTHDELREIKAHYKAKLKELRKENE